MGEVEAGEGEEGEEEEEEENSLKAQLTGSVLCCCSVPCRAQSGINYTTAITHECLFVAN